MDIWNFKRRRDTHRIELWSKSIFVSDILNVLRMDWVTLVVETWVNESLSYLEFTIKGKTPYYWNTFTKRVSIPRDWPKPGDRIIVHRYIIRDESEESNRNCKFLANAVFGWWHIRTQKCCVANTYVAVNTIRSCDHIRVVLKEMRSVYYHMIILG